MAKVNIKSEKITRLGGIFHVREQFPLHMVLFIDEVLKLRCSFTIRISREKALARFSCAWVCR